MFIDNPISSVILIITVAFSAYCFSNPQLMGKFMLHPYSIYRKKNLFTLLTSGFIHRDWMHLLFNMITFYYFGFGLESVLASISSWGHLQFAVIYFVSMILSDLPTVFQYKNNGSYHSLGASGAVCAVLFGFILFQPKMTIGIMFIIPMPAYLFGVLFLAYCMWASKKSNDGINHSAHFYGALSGLMLTILFHPNVIQYFISQF